MNAMNTMPLQLSGVQQHFPGRTVLAGVDFAAARGEVIGLLGRNGAGKTTLLQCALGLLPADAGDIRLFGEAQGQLSDAVRARIGYVPQHSDLFGWMSAQQMLDFFAQFYPRWNHDKVRKLMLEWSVPPAVRIERLSGGEQQRLAIIRALAHDPELLILDEPVASLDPVARREFLRQLVLETVERETTIVFSTHIISDLERVATQVALLSAGKVLLQVPLDRIAECTRRLVGPAALVDAVPAEQELARQEHGAQVSRTVLFQSAEGCRRAMQNHPNIAIDALALEEVFVEVAK